jgi:hypothetical protein
VIALIRSSLGVALIPRITTMALLKKVEFEQVGSSEITIAVSETDDGIVVGRVVAKDGGKMFSTAPYDPPIKDAISIASRFATVNKVAVSVYDPQNRWQPSWGTLR